MLLQPTDLEPRSDLHPGLWLAAPCSPKLGAPRTPRLGAPRTPRLGAPRTPRPGAPCSPKPGARPIYLNPANP